MKVFHKTDTPSSCSAICNTYKRRTAMSTWQKYFLCQHVVNLRNGVVLGYMGSTVYAVNSIVGKILPDLCPDVHHKHLYTCAIAYYFAC